MESANMRRNTQQYATLTYLTNLFILTSKKMSNIMNSSATGLHNFLIQVKNFLSTHSLRSYLVIYNILLIIFLLFLLIKCRNKCKRTKRRDASPGVEHKVVDAVITEASSKDGGKSHGMGGSKRRGGSQSRRTRKRSGSTWNGQITNKNRATSKARTTSSARNTRSKGRNASKGKKTPKGNQNRNSDFEQEQNLVSRIYSLRSRARNQKDHVQRENSLINTKRSGRTGLEITQMNKMVTSNSLTNVSLPYADISSVHLNLKEKDEKKKKAMLKEKKKN
ncbi:hypothetical protein AK88_05269 [Plasmodium fragile]|uniref:Uncharacterized protein n=1 Tax=Plasmodium fragile TaxID=5857 RepID=A0A0D9QDJ0_PLAFR|nr:uncharacterized protein AK88_05269 [Plasmodium fragile]KJP85100.1 hypothetical protein AK88_05269 [Plasmodium fragile]